MELEGTLIVIEEEDRLAVQPDPEPEGAWRLYGLHCGDGLAIFDTAAGTYRPGRVENSPQGDGWKGWYWTDGMFSKPLRPGMKVRGWVDAPGVSMEYLRATGRMGIPPRK